MFGFVFKFFGQFFEKAVVINAIGAFVEHFRGSSYTARRGKSDAMRDGRGRFVAVYAEVFEGHAAAHAEADEHNLFVIFGAQGVLDDFAEVADVAVTIEAKRTVHLAAARAAVPSEGVPAVFGEHFCHAFDVRTMRVAFQTMRQNDQFSAALVEPIQIYKIAVCQVESLALVVNAFDFAKCAGENGLQMPVELVAGRITIGGVMEDWHIV